MPQPRTQSKPSGQAGAAKKAAKGEAAAPRLSRTRRPTELPVVDWQTALRRQFGREQDFGLENLGDEPVFSDFRVHNPASGSRWRVNIRGRALGQNFCTCPDFATNDLGTCKHIEFTLAKLERKRGGKAALARGFQPRYSEIWLDCAGLRQLRFTPGTACPPELLAQAGTWFDAAAGWALPLQRLEGVQALVHAAQQRGHELRCRDEAWALVAQVRDDQQRQQRLQQAYPGGADDAGLASLLKVPLYRYQLEGALFAVHAGRALLGDDMGLGKTVQAVAAAELFARHFGVQRVLVVCPTSLKHQWKNEFLRFSERSVQVVGGLRAQRQAAYREDAFCMITHYETLHRDADLIAAWAPDLVIADEAQRIKNWNTIAARALKRIQSPYALVLTGTPLQNRLEELISIVQFVDQHRLGPTWRLLDEHQRRDEVGRVVGYRALDRIGQTLAPVMLRRRKSEVLTQLPERVDQHIFVPLTDEQRAHHDDNADVVARIVLRWRKTGFLSDKDQLRMQIALQNMRMSCNSTWLLDHETDHGNKVDELMLVLEDLLQSPDAKAVVFSQWIGTHELIQRRLQARAAALGGDTAAGGAAAWGHVLFNGQVPSEQRGALIDRFHRDPDCRLFLSTDAGGVGLNLQHAAAVVVNMDLPWNPAVLEQRIGRVHRMGQSRGVQVINFVGQGSIEEGMLKVLAFKTSLFAGVLDGGDADVFMQGTRLSQFMDSVDQVASAMGQPDAQADSETAVEPASATHAETPDGPAETQRGGGTDETQDAVAKSSGEPMADAEAPTSAQPTLAQPTIAQSGPAADPWAALLEVGAALLQGLATQQRSPAAPLGAGHGVGHGAGNGSSGIRIERDPDTGQTSVRLPLPDPALLQRLVQALQPWLK